MSKDTKAPGIDFASRLADARSRGLARVNTGFSGINEEWPKASDVSVQDALADFTLTIIGTGLKVSLGCNSDGESVWVRLSFDNTSTDERRGKVAFTVGGTVESALCKAIQLLETNAPKVWKPDVYETRLCVTLLVNSKGRHTV